MCNNRNSVKGGRRRGKQACYRLAQLLVLKCSARITHRREKYCASFCSHRKYLASVWQQGSEKGFLQLRSGSSSCEMETGSLNPPTMVRRRERPCLMSGEPSRRDALGLERQITGSALLETM